MLDKLFALYDSIVVLDTETTGIEFKIDKIIELSAVRIVSENGIIRITHELDEFIKLPDGMSIPPEIVKLTGITDEMLHNQGNMSNFVCKKFIEMFTDDKILVVAYNAQFDMNFIYYFLAENNCASVLKKINMLDALTVYKDRAQYPHKLENAIVKYNLENKVVNSHRAIDDTLALIEVLKAMAEECDDLHKYINLFGYNPKYGVSGSKIKSVTYKPQPYNLIGKLYGGL